jgi:hypothetical protein
VSWIDDLIKQVRDYDADRPRSQQVKVGWSEVGGCRAYLGYRLADAWPTDDTDSWGAQRGTAIHEYLERITAAPGIRVEVDTEYRGIPGHADIVGPDFVGDFKTTSLASSRMWADSPDVMLQKRIQAHGYAAGLVDAGDLPADATVRLIVIPVDGTFADWWCYEEPFNRSLADMGADRLDEVRGLMAAGEPLPKDKPWNWCMSWCQFASVCRDTTPPETEVITDLELVAAVGRYGKTTQQITRLYKEKDGLAETIRGLRGTAGEWRISLSKPGEAKEVLDEDVIRADYERRGVDLPVTEKPGAAPRLNVMRSRKAAKP